MGLSAQLQTSIPPCRTIALLVHLWHCHVEWKKGESDKHAPQIQASHCWLIFVALICCTKPRSCCTKSSNLGLINFLKCTRTTWEWRHNSSKVLQQRERISNWDERDCRSQKNRHEHKQQQQQQQQQQELKKQQRQKWKMMCAAWHCVRNSGGIYEDESRNAGPDVPVKTISYSQIYFILTTPLG